MMQDGRSPTVDAAYARNPFWWEENGGLDDAGGYDVDGFDSRGWNADGEDRAHRSIGAYAPGTPGLSARLNDAYEAGQRLLSKLDRRIPRSVSKRITKAVAALLSSHFPGTETDGLSGPVSPGVPAILKGFNAVRDPYAGVYWRPVGGQQEFFTVIAEQNLVSQHGFDPRNTWSATVMWKDAFGEGEDRFLGKTSLDSLMSAISDRLAGFRPGRSKHVVFIEDAGTDLSSFGAMALDDFAELEANGSPPGDWVGEVLAVGPADALAEFRGKGERTPGFEAMIERGLESHRAGSALRRVEPLP